LQEDAGKPPVSKLIHKFATDKDATAGENALLLLRDSNASLQTSTAVGCIELLLSRVDHLPSPLSGRLVGDILRASKGARVHFARRLNNNYEEVIMLCQKLGEDAVDVLIMILLDPTSWENESVNSNCLRDCFKWFLLRLKAGESSTARSVARLLAGKADSLHSYVNQDGLGQLLKLLDLNASVELRSHATLAAATFLETSGEVGQSMVGKFMGSLLAADGDDDLRLAFSVAAAIFPLEPQVVAQSFLTDGFVEELVPSLQARPADVEAAALEMLSAACTDKSCRMAIAAHCSDYLEAVVKSGDSGKSTAAIILTKIKYGRDPSVAPGKEDMDRLATVFKELMLQNDGEGRDTSVEGLAYTSLKGTVKEMLIKDKIVIRRLMEALKTSTVKPTVMFGALTIIGNLTVYPPVLSKEQQKVAELKNYAESQPNVKVEPDLEDKEEMVTPRCKSLIDAGVVPALVACSKKITPNAMDIVSNIILSLSKHQKHRGIIAQQGGVKLSLQFYASSSSDTNRDRLIKQTSAHALARILVSVNPSHVFSSQSAISSAIRPLFSILEDIEDRKDLLPVFETLMALTNLASVDNGIRDQIIRSGWTKIEDLLLHDNAMIQRATVELVCNLMASPSGVAKFADGSGAASNRLHLLLALADAEDLATRRASGGALAMLTEWDRACEAVVGRERGIKIVLDMVADENEEMRHRGMVIVRNLVCGIGGYAAKVRSEGGVEVLRNSLKMTRQPEVLEIGVEVLKMLMQV
jgi:hypothetical protein